MMFSDLLRKSLIQNCLNPRILEVLDYAVLPAGKLFRPKLIESLSLDLNKTLPPSLIQLALAVELHHAYTLIHDDLPCMDNDLLRRGKASTHAHFGEWKALLAGDALILLSLNELSKIEHPQFKKILKLFLWATGPKGLINGQFSDLSSDGCLNTSEIVRIHELKTSRLIQVCTVGSYYLSCDFKLSSFKDFLKLGSEIGICFQLIDDLNELCEESISQHEIQINPFMREKFLVFQKLKKSHQGIKEIISKHQLNHLKEMLQNYFENNQKYFENKMGILKTNLDIQTDELENFITSFASL